MVPLAPFLVDLLVEALVPLLVPLLAMVVVLENVPKSVDSTAPPLATKDVECCAMVDVGQNVYWVVVLIVPIFVALLVEALVLVDALLLVDQFVLQMVVAPPVKEIVEIVHVAPPV